MVWQRKREILVDRHITGESAIDRWRSEEDHVPAQVVVAGAALPARAARHARLQRDTLPELMAPRQIPSADDNPRGLVAEHHGCIDDEVPDPTVLVVVDVRPADADRRHLDQDLPGTRKRNRPVLDPEVAYPVEHGRLV